MVLGRLPVPGRPTIWITVGQGPTALTVGAGWGCLDIFTLLYLFSSVSPSLWETARYRLSERAVKPKTTNQLSNFYAGRPKAALLFWFVGDFRCDAVIYRYSCYILKKI